MCSSGKVVVWVVVFSVLVLTLNFEVGKIAKMQLPENNERKLVIGLAVAKLKVKTSIELRKKQN